MAMSMRTLWSIEQSLLNSGRSTRSGCIPTTTTENVTMNTGFPVPPGQQFQLILVTHDESTFYKTDRQKTTWGHKSDKPVPLKKGEGSSLMASIFLTMEWGRLQNADGMQ